MSLPRYQQYKDSGVEWIGEIPEGWECLMIKRLSSVRRGASPRPIHDPKYFDNEGEFAWVIELPTDYAEWLGDLKQRIHAERLRVVLASNAAMVLLYWEIGRRVLEKQTHKGWGAKIIDRLAADLREAFPEMKGFSPRNIKYMRAFAAAWPKREIVQEALAQLTWYHNIALLVKEKNRVLVEYAIVGKTKPISIAEWETRLTRSLPDELKESLPSIEEIEAELAGEVDGDD